MADKDMKVEEDLRNGRGRINDPERTRADILDVATAHFSRFGLSGSRVDDIAQETHTSKRMLYYYFGSKEGLYRAVLARSYGEIRALESQAEQQDASPVAALRRLVEVTFDYHQNNPDFVRIVMVENIHRGAHIGDVPGIDTRASSVAAELGNLLQLGGEQQVFRSDIDPIDLHMSISALCFYNVSNRHTFAKIFARDMETEGALAARRESVVDMVLRWVMLSVPSKND